MQALRRVCEVSGLEAAEIKRIVPLTLFLARTLPAILGYGVGAAILLGVYDYTGGSLAGFPSDPEQDEFARKQHLRKNRRRPIEETIQELGEGRGTNAAKESRSVRKIY